MGPLGRRVVTLCDATLGEIDGGPVADRVREIRAGLREPLRVAVAGRLKAGKSTLVNALLRQRIAAVDVGECTRVVTWFRYGPQEKVEVRATSGETWGLALDADGGLPRALGAEPETLAAVTVWLPNEALRETTIIDTPGLESLNTEYSSATERLLALDDDSRRAVAHADALVYLMPHLGEAEEALLRGFRSLFAGSGLSAVNAVGVLSKVDVLAGDDDPDPMRVGRQLADRYAQRLRAEVSNVVPVIGLLAETADTDSFTERDAAALRDLAALDADQRAEMLLSADWFLDDQVNVDRERRRRLLHLLDLHGIRRALELIDGGHADAGELAVRLSDLSGVAALRATLDRTFATRADALKAHVALSDLERLSYSPDADDPAALRFLRDAVEDLRLDPSLHRVNELEALRLRAAGAVDLEADLADDLDRIAHHEDARERLALPPDAPDDLVAQTALARATRWLAYQNDARTPADGARIAALLRDSLVLMWEEVSS